MYRPLKRGGHRRRRTSPSWAEGRIDRGAQRAAMPRDGECAELSALRALVGAERRSPALARFQFQIFFLSTKTVLRREVLRGVYPEGGLRRPKDSGRQCVG